MKKNRVKIAVIALIAVILMGIISFIMYNWFDDADDYEGQLKLGNQYLNEENYEEAIVAFRKAIEINENSTEARNGLVKAYVATGRFDEATTVLDEIKQSEQEAEESYSELSKVIDSNMADDVAIDYIEATLAYDIEAMLNTMPEAFEDGIKDSDEYEEILEQVEAASDMIDVNVDSIEVGKTKEIKDTEILEERINSTIKEMNSDADKIKVEEAMSVTVEVTVEVAGRKGTENMTVTTFKDENTGNWYVWDPSF